MRRQVGAPMGNVPVVDEVTQLLARAIEERLLRGRQLRRLRSEQLLPARRAGEQFPIPPHGARFQSLFFRLRHRGQKFEIGLHEGPRDDSLAQRHDIDEPQEPHEDP